MPCTISRRSLVAVASIAVVGAAACSSSSSKGQPTTPKPSATSSSAATTTVANAAPSLTSSAFHNGTDIPRKYGCTRLGGNNVSPPLAWAGFPSGDVTLVLVVHDPDAPIPGGFTHLVTTMTPGSTSVPEGANAAGGATSQPMAKWLGPCPPSGTHHYRF